MQLPKLALNNYQFVFLIVVIAIILGSRAFINMPRSENPKMELPFYILWVHYPGTSPKDMEKLIIKPLENVLDNIDGVLNIHSFMGEGKASIDIEVASNIDPIEKFNEIQSEFDKIRSSLPTGITNFNFFRSDPSELTAIYQYGLLSESVNYADLTDLAEQLKNRFDKIKGIYKVEIQGYPEEEIRVSLDFQRMTALNVSLTQVINSLRSNNLNIPGGEVNAGSKAFTIIASSGYQNLEEIENTIILKGDGAMLRLKDISKIGIEYSEHRWIARHNQSKAIWISIMMDKGTNILQLAKKIKKVESEFSKTLPTNIQLVTAFEQPTMIKEKIDDFSYNLIQGVILVAAIIFFFISWRAAAIISFTIPLCFLISLAILNSSGFALQQVSIAGLILALGLIVDNGIVVIESIDRHLEEGLALKAAVIQGTSEVGYAIISSTVTTIFAFFPLTQLGAGGGEFIKSLPLIVTISMFTSLVLALIIIPVLAHKIMRNKQSNEIRLADKFFNWINNEIYGPALQFSLRYGWITFSAALVLLIFSTSLFSKIGVTLLPPADKPFVLIDIEAPVGTSIYEADKAVTFVEQVLDTIPFVKNYSANSGHSNPQIFLNRFSNYKANRGQVLANFKYWDNQKFYSTLNTLRKEFKKYPAAKITISELKLSPGKPPIEFLIKGENSDSLKKIALQVEEILEKTPQVINIKNPLGVDKTGLKIKLNKEKASLNQISMIRFHEVIRAGLNGSKVDEVSLKNGKNYPLFVRLSVDNKPAISDFSKLYFKSSSGTYTPLRQFADINFKSLSPQIIRLNKERLTRVLADVSNANQIISTTNEVNHKLQELDLPDNYNIHPGGELTTQEDLFSDLGFIFVLILIAIFAVLVLQFKSIFQPLIIFSAIPFAISGSFLLLYLTEWSFSLFAFIGFISLSGIVVNDSILIVDQINQLRNKGMEKLEAIKLGSKKRLIPVILTTLTTVVGLLPLLLSKSNLWTPICITIIGGMLTATFMILLIVPVLYNWITK